MSLLSLFCKAFISVLYDIATRTSPTVPNQIGKNLQAGTISPYPIVLKVTNAQYIPSVFDHPEKKKYATNKFLYTTFISANFESLIGVEHCV